VRDEDGVAREVEEPADGELDRRRAAEGGRVDPGQRGDRRRQRPARVDERLEPLLELEAADAHGADLADRRAPRREPGRLQVEDDVGRVLEQERGARRLGEPDARSPPGEAGVALDDVREQGAGEPGGHVAERVEGLRRVLRRHGPVPCLDELDEPVRRVERELHGSSLGEHVFACKRKEKAAPPDPRCGPSILGGARRG
jgi:hypothetical protein